MNGAGVGADGLTIAACGAHPLAVPTALVDQDSRGVRGFVRTDDALFRRMLTAALVDGRPNAVKLGMLADAARAEVVADLLADLLPPHIPIVVDPVLTGGLDGETLAQSGAATYGPLLALARDRLVVLTPNAHELMTLTAGAVAITTEVALTEGAQRLATASGAWVLAKGGHIEPPGVDVLASPEGPHTRFDPVEPAPPTDVHGTGCRLSSAVATALGRRVHVNSALPSSADLLDAVREARAVMAKSFANAVMTVGAGRPQFAAGGPNSANSGAIPTGWQTLTRGD